MSVYRNEAKSDLVDLSGRIAAETDKAILFDDGVTREWLPKSQIEIAHPDSKRPMLIEVTLPEWLAKEKGLI